MLTDSTRRHVLVKSRGWGTGEAPCGKMPSHWGIPAIMCALEADALCCMGFCWHPKTDGPRTRLRVCWQSNAHLEFAFGLWGRNRHRLCASVWPAIQRGIHEPYDQEHQVTDSCWSSWTWAQKLAGSVELSSLDDHPSRPDCVGHLNCGERVLKREA